MRVMVDEIANAAETITEAEVARVKAQMKVGLLMALESSGARIGQIARQMIAWGRPIPLEEMVAKGRCGDGRKRPRRRPRLIARGKPAIAVIGLGSGLESAAAIAETLTAAGRLTESFRQLPNQPTEWRSSAPSIFPNPTPRSPATASCLRTPQVTDYAEWAALREASRDFLTPWEPTWPADDLSRGAFRRRHQALRRGYAHRPGLCLPDLPQSR